MSHPNRPHDVSFPFSWRFLQTGWRLLFFNQGDWRDDPKQSAAYNRGGYLVEALSHCQECHTPRNPLGGLDRSKPFAGTPHGPEGVLVPNITPDPETGIGNWGKDDLAQMLKTGETPEFSTVAKSMGEAIDDGLKYLTEEDRAAIATYILAQKPIRNAVRAAGK